MLDGLHFAHRKQPIGVERHEHRLPSPFRECRLDRSELLDQIHLVHRRLDPDVRVRVVLPRKFLPLVFEVGIDLELPSVPSTPASELRLQRLC